MTDLTEPTDPDAQDEPHVPTEQENELYRALMADDVETVEQLRTAAYDADQEHDETGVAGPRQQFDTDYGFAHQRYQEDHEIPEDQREQHTADQVEDENTAAREREPQPESD
jgi:hypothetical protein